MFSFGHVDAIYAQPAPSPTHATYPVGMATRPYADPSRRNWTDTGPRPLRTAVWYPAADGTQETEMVEAGLFIGGAVAPEAPISRARRTYPLILLSHGTGGSAVQMMWLGRLLASRGYIAAAVNHHGNTGAEPNGKKAQGFLMYWERPKDLTAVLDHLLTDAMIGARIDRARIGAAGFSLGGFTVISLGGARFSAAQYDAFCTSSSRDFTCEPQAEYPQAHAEFDKLRTTDPVVVRGLSHSDDSYRDRRVKAVFAIAPALGGGFTKRSLARVGVPVWIVVGKGDDVTPMATNASRYAQAIPGAELTEFPSGVGHYTFLDTCNTQGVRVLDICRDGPGVERSQVHTDVAVLADTFFRRTLRLDDGYRK